MSRKIILLGLSQAGKTSIRTIVERQMEQVADESVAVMDLGGPGVFLDRILNSMSSFIFRKVAALVFICDISTSDKFPASLKAFIEVMSRFEELADVEPAVYILLHKTDLLPDLTQRAERMESLMNMFSKSAIAQNKNIRFFQTSIYDGSIHEAFKRIITELPDKDHEDPPTPFIYKFPYPKGPPAASANPIPLRKPIIFEEESEEKTTNDLIPHKKGVEEEFSDEEESSNS